jgi:hypothetical protein
LQNWFPVSVVKPKTPLFLYKEVNYMTDHPELIVNGWRKCGML